MEIHLLHIFTFLSLALVGSYADLPPEAYWKSVLPNTPMPKVVKDLLLPEWLEGKGSSVGLGKGSVNADVGKGKKGGGGTKVNVGGKGVGVSTGKPDKQTNLGVGKGGVSVGTDRELTPSKAFNPCKIFCPKPGPKPLPKPLPKPPPKSLPKACLWPLCLRPPCRLKRCQRPPLYKYNATEDQELHDNLDVTLFFTEKDMHQGEKMKLHFVNSRSEATFLPRQVAKTVPFSLTQFPEILNSFSVEPDSIKAELMKTTIKECEAKETEGEEKYCATSLESMIDFSMLKLGKKVNAISTEVKKETEVQRYTIEGVESEMVGDKAAIVCHKQNYVYAVFYCYKTSSVKAYKVSLVGDDGTKAEAVAVCHEDTSAWNPNHLAFQMLKIKPGSVPVCNFLPEDNIVWVPY
ncbi:hypothetical protein LguiB_027637 [Lonicera macranthoides]